MRSTHAHTKRLGIMVGSFERCVDDFGGGGTFLSIVSHRATSRRPKSGDNGGGTERQRAARRGAAQRALLHPVLFDSKSIAPQQSVARREGKTPVEESVSEKQQVKGARACVRIFLSQKEARSARPANAGNGEVRGARREREQRTSCAERGGGEREKLRGKAGWDGRRRAFAGSRMISARSSTTTTTATTSLGERNARKGEGKGKSCCPAKKTSS